MEQETKKRIYLWIYPSTELQVKQMVERCGYKSPSEFIEAAVLNYIGQLTTAENMDYVAQTLSTVVEGALFKQAVELAMVENILVNLSGYSADDIQRLRGKVVKDVKNLKGNYDFVTAAKYQNGDAEPENSTL